jgi:hypothetical protein
LIEKAPDWFKPLIKAALLTGARWSESHGSRLDLDFNRWAAFERSHSNAVVAAKQVGSARDESSRVKR